jgi:predicted membrane protein
VGINSENLIEKITTFPIFISYSLEIILLYATTRYRSLFEGNFLMPSLQSFIWIHYIILSLTIIIVNIKYDTIRKKDLIRKEKKQLKLQQKEIRMKNILENNVFV